MIVVLLANGFEEIEALTPVDMLRRAGLDVKTVGISGKTATGSHGISVVCDALPEEIDLSKVTMAIFPGGMPGATNLDSSEFTDKIISAVINNGGHLAAICAAPLVFGRRGLLDGKKATCYPGFENELVGATYTDCAYVTDGNITTAKAMGAALDFAEELISICLNKEKAEEVSSSIYRSSPAPSSDDGIDDDFIAKLNALLSSPKEEKKPDCTAEIGEIPFVRPDYSNYSVPPIDLLAQAEEVDTNEIESEIASRTEEINNLFASFNVSASVVSAKRGPRITRYDVMPTNGTKVNKILNLIDDIALCLGVSSIRAEAPVPGDAIVGIEVPNKSSKPIRLREIIDTEEFKNAESPTTVAIGADISGDPIIYDIAKMPHMLIGGAVGMGKSVFINSLITSLIYKASPDEVKMVLIDPKHVELTPFKNIPHLLMPILHDPRESVAALKWISGEMERRYALMQQQEVRNIQTYNEKVGKESALPRIVIIIDEFADLMLQVKSQIEPLVVRLAQKARAAGIYLVIATQRPSSDVITGIIKANIPTRIAFKVVSHIDSRTMIDCKGAEKLLGRGDALFAPLGYTTPRRVQCALILDDENTTVAKYIKESTGEAAYDPNILAFITNEAKMLGQKSVTRMPKVEGEEFDYMKDPLFLSAVEIALSEGKISTSLIQRKLSIGYGKAARFIDAMEDMGVVSEFSGTKPREVLITKEQWKEKLTKA